MGYHIEAQTSWRLRFGTQFTDWKSFLSSDILLKSVLKSSINNTPKNGSDNGVILHIWQHII